MDHTWQLVDVQMDLGDVERMTTMMTDNEMTTAWCSNKKTAHGDHRTRQDYIVVVVVAI
jgi:hypothetical protein